MQKKSYRILAILLMFALVMSVFLLSSCKQKQGSTDGMNASNSSAEGKHDSTEVLIEGDKPALGIPELSGTGGYTDPVNSDEAGQVSAGGEAKPAGSSTGEKPSGENPPEAKPTEVKKVAQPDPSKPAVSYVKTPTASGTKVETSDVSGESVIDYSNVSQGYVMLKNSGAANKLKALVITPNGIQYQYILESDGKFIVCPLQAGNGKYAIHIAENVSGTTYQPLVSVEVDVALADANLPFLYPNHRVNFSESSACVAKAADLTRGMTSDLHKIESIYNYIIENIKYDQSKVNGLQSKSEYIPDPDRTLREGKGICSDFSSLLAAMLRSQNIPTKMIEGYAAPGNIEHAWNLIYTKEKGVIVTEIEFNGTWRILDSTYGSSLGKDLERFIGNGSGYGEKFVY